MPEKPSFLDKPEEGKQIEEKKEQKEKKIYTTGRGEVLTPEEVKDLKKRSWDEIK
jgi:hypothetical protein